MKARPIFILASVLVIGLALGYVAGRYQAGRYAVHCALRPEGGVVEMWRYDTYTGRTWICYTLGDDTSWKEVSEGDERFTSSAERNASSPRRKDSAENSRTQFSDEKSQPTKAH